MDITPVVGAGRQLINAYGNGQFRIANQVYRGSVLVFPDRTVPWAVASMADVTWPSLAEVRAAEAVEVLLLGCGTKAGILPEAVRAGLDEAGIVAECMDTGAACRTFNVLLAEERRAAAALIAVG